ncbi:antibiotic biosynthesis monooxygenase [Sphingobacterium faecium NBRC 15299]|jgi:quinol monooxygenase YgiN|uniref:putative quinol monooxygenase n=1 Tax=Sphingobacterium faecium TaxID=34087 RepID=UPI000D37D15C|nr:putative quinol monooxygenase [Sphingobacterium faecium]MQP28614.1 antibiotic biosynthesis monooxygenase [Sphingobacterium faecium]PTX11486.1 quinol monooxygenase YgiN [Sphingobacterium faecium]UZJ66251.1 antibiotic biosynthesis monooxygenase [Sphingobacterium sp. KU25419]GEM64642.1 antibiotic biosynthesis monooxygenase [Sphingobacterium faecium NBRC 15299]
MKIYLTVVLRVKETHREQIKNTLLEMVRLTRLEPAAELYNLHQGIEDPNVFTFYEIWTDQAGLDAHNEQPYIKDFGPSYGTLLADQPNVIKTTLI